jgi:hypothetical protein
VFHLPIKRISFQQNCIIKRWSAVRSVRKRRYTSMRVRVSNGFALDVDIRVRRLPDTRVVLIISRSTESSLR